MKEKEGIGTYQDGINTREFLAKLIGKWYLFLGFGILGLFVGIMVTKYLASRYEVSSILLVKQESKNEVLNSVFNPQINSRNTSSLINQVGIIKSYKLNYRALENLKWDISIFEDGLLNDTDMYLNEPFTVQKLGDSVQTEMTSIYVTPVSNDLLEIKIKEVMVDGRSKDVSITKQIRWNEPFLNEYFNFKVIKNPIGTFIVGQQYRIVFNNLSQLAHSYMERLDVTLADEKSDLIYSKLKTKQPGRDANYLNELAKVYIDFGLEEKNIVADNTLLFINNQLIGITDSLSVASEYFTNFRSQNKIVNLDQESALVVENLEEVERQESASRMKLEYYNNLKKYLNDTRQLRELVVPSVVGITDVSLNALVLNLSELYGKREVLSYSVQGKNPNLIRLDSTIQYTKKVLRENIDNLLSNTYGELANLGERKKHVNSLLTRLPKTEQRLVNIKRAFDLNNELYTFLLKKRAEVGIARASNTPDATVLDGAQIDAAVSIGPKKIQIILLSIFLGLSIPFIALLVGEYFDNTIKGPEEAEGESMSPVVGNILVNKFKTGLPVVQNPNSSIAESFRTLRTNLQHFLINHPGSKVIAVHSTGVGEGKSFVAVNLASSLSSRSRKVLLIEGDMRNTRLHTLLECNGEYGLSSYLNGDLPLGEIIQPTKIIGMSFLGSGSEEEHPSELLNNGILENLVNEARKEFDYIIIDSVPLTKLSDAASLGRFADINIVVLRIRLTTVDQLKFANKIAKEGIIKNVSIVVNDVSYKGSKVD